MICKNCKMPIVNDGCGDFVHTNDRYACYSGKGLNPSHSHYSFMATPPTTVVVEAPQKSMR